MPSISSPHWNLTWNFCTKHHSNLPCTECIASEDKDIAVELTLYDINSSCRKRSRMKDMFLPEHKWMYERMMN